jgi:hypothetical protein
MAAFFVTGQAISERPSLPYNRSQLASANHLTEQKFFGKLFIRERHKEEKAGQFQVSFVSYSA